MTTNNNTSLHPVHAVYDGIFNTASGIKVNLHAPTADMINLGDISKALGYICRFGGNINKYYSVAQHCVLVVHLAPAPLKKAALLHDASEAYLGDVIKPLKVVLGEAYSSIEERFMRLIGYKYGIDPADFDRVKQYDRIALEIEHNAFQKGHMRDWSDMWATEIGYKYATWNPEFAGLKFLDYAGELGLLKMEAPHVSY